MKQRISEYTVPAKRGPETIADVFTIVITTMKKNTGHVEARNVHLTGTVAEKLQQYKDATGTDWTGFDEQVFGIYEEVADMSLNLNAKLERIMSDTDQEIQAKIDRLTEKAERHLQENETAKTHKKLVTAISTRTE